MSNLLARTSLLLPLLLACDPDGDLLSGSLEKELGTDRASADSDGDTLSDFDEHYLHHTDPTNADSDGDGDEDGWEISVGLDPLDETSRRYAGGWPHVSAATKDELQREEAPALVEVGKRVRNLQMWDQFGQRFELYDAARQGVPVVVLVTANRNPQHIGNWLNGENTFEPGRELGNLSEAIIQAVRADQIRLVVMLSTGGGATGEVLRSDATSIGNGFLPAGASIIALADEGYAAWGHFNVPYVYDGDEPLYEFGWRVAVLDEHMIVRGLDDWDVALELLAQ